MIPESTLGIPSDRFPIPDGDDSGIWNLESGIWNWPFLSWLRPKTAFSNRQWTPDETAPGISPPNDCLPPSPGGVSFMKLGLINSAWVQSGRGTAFGIRKTKEIGFDSIDIFADPLEIDVKEKRLIQDECAAAGLPIVSIACVAVGLIDFNPSVQRFHVERVRAYLDMAYLFEARNVLLVLGEYIWQREVIPPAEQWQVGVEHVRALGEYAAGLGLEIALELEPFALSLLNDVPSMVRFLDEVNHPAVKANLDISHLALAHQPASSIAALKGRVAHVHISDCDGKVHGDRPPGRGVVDFPPYLEAIRQLEIPEAAVSIELEYAPEPAKIVEWVAEAYEKTAGLMRAAGLRS